MTYGYALQSVLEVVGFFALVLALIFENRIAAWEERVIKRIKRRICRRGQVISFERRDGGRAI